MAQRITYRMDPDTGLFWSRLGSRVAVPVLDYDGMTPDNGFFAGLYLEHESILTVAHTWNYLIPCHPPADIKAWHRHSWATHPSAARAA